MIFLATCHYVRVITKNKVNTYYKLITADRSKRTNTKPVSSRKHSLYEHCDNRLKAQHIPAVQKELVGLLVFIAHKDCVYQFRAVSKCANIT